MENTILVGSALKNKRKELGLSQKEMVGSVLSVSYYSKVERNLFDINVNDLTLLNGIGEITAINFIDGLKDNINQYNYYSEFIKINIKTINNKLNDKKIAITGNHSVKRNEIINEIIKLLSIANDAHNDLIFELELRDLTEKESNAIQKILESYEKIAILEAKLK